jgi:hypothetical protein
MAKAVAVRSTLAATDPVQISEISRKIGWKS